MQINEDILSADQFPSIPLEEEEASALWIPFRQQPWWCSDVNHFPMLIECPRTFLLQDILAKIPISSAWPDWKFLDKFAVVITCIAAGIPYLNDWMNLAHPASAWNLHNLSEEQALSVLVPQLNAITTLLQEDKELFSVLTPKPMGSEKSYKALSVGLVEMEKEKLPPSPTIVMESLQKLGSDGLQQDLASLSQDNSRMESESAVNSDKGAATLERGEENSLEVTNLAPLEGTSTTELLVMKGTEV